MRRLVVGLDYGAHPVLLLTYPSHNSGVGTSNSGVAYTIFDDEKDNTPGSVDITVIKDLTNSPNGQGPSEKLPSDIAYDANWNPTGYAYDVPHDSKITWVKLLLEPGSLKFKNEENARRLWRTYNVLPGKKRPVDVVADYLQWIWGRAKQCILEREDDPELFDKVDLTVILTIPPAWSDRAKQGLQRAADTAGIAKEAQILRLVPEAEAAAIFGLKLQAQEGAIVENDCVIVVDAGGGTVDVISYKVLSRSPFSIDQATESVGELCGSAFIDLEFHNQLELALGEVYKSLPDVERVHLNDAFEAEIKRSYLPQRSGGPQKYTIPLSQGKRHSIDAAIVAQSFDSIMTPVETLIDNQFHQLRRRGLESNVKGIVLVGGLSKSEYIFQRIRDTYASKQTKVWRPDEPWTAVAQGAVYCETTAVIHARLAKHSYGILYRDNDNNKRVHWIILKGTSVRTEMITDPFSLRVEEQAFLSEDWYFRTRVTLVRSDVEDVAATFDDHHVRPHAVIECRFPTSMLTSESAERTEDGNRVWHITARFVPILNGAVIAFRCKVDGNEVALTELDYFEDSTDQDFHPLKTTSTGSSGRTARRKIRDYHFNTRVDKDTPSAFRPKPGSLPGLFARGWIPKKEFYADYEEE